MSPQPQTYTSADSGTSDIYPGVAGNNDINADKSAYHMLFNGWSYHDPELYNYRCNTVLQAIEQ